MSARQAGSKYDEYVRREWADFVRDPERARATLETAHVEEGRILDVGCGAGQELLPFVATRPVLGVGLDVAPSVGLAGRELFRDQSLSGHVTFVRASAEHLPFATASFEVVVCRLALPYTHNGTALAEMARVVRPGGLILLKIHHVRFYLRRFQTLLSARNYRAAFSIARVLIAGALYQLTGSQVQNRIVGRESFQTERLLRKELARCGLKIEKRLPDSNPRTPSFVVTTARSLDSIGQR